MQRTEPDYAFLQQRMGIADKEQLSAALREMVAKTTKGVALEIKEQFMNIHPWKTYYLNGEYVVPYLHNGIYFPLRLNNETE